MNYTFMPSLKHRALVKITAALWNRSDIRDSVAGCLTLCDPSPIRAGKWQEIEDKVLGMVPKLPLPVSLKKEVLELAPRMGLQVKKWKGYHGHYNRHVGIDVSAELCWTPQGTVDRKKTAEVLVKDDRIDIAMRYRLACNYCLEGDVKELWNAMPERKKEDIYEEEKKISYENTLTVFWTCYVTDSSKCYDLIKEMAGREVSPYQFLLEHSAECANKAAAEYFLQKLTAAERNESLVKCARDLVDIHSTLCTIGSYYKYGRIEGYEAEFLCFLLSQMDVEQQVKLLKIDPFGVLACLLDWPFEHFFMETANRVWGVLSEDHFQDLLLAMVFRVNNDFKNCNYHELFGEFWQQSPNNYKKYVAGRLTSDILLQRLFVIGDKENIRLIFKIFTLEERKEVIFSDMGISICKRLIDFGKWDLLKLFIEECVCISSEDMMSDIEEVLRNIVSKKSEESPESIKNWLTKFLQFRDDLHEDYEKRCMEKTE